MSGVDTNVVPFELTGRLMFHGGGRILTLEDQTGRISLFTMQVPWPRVGSRVRAVGNADGRRRLMLAEGFETLEVLPPPEAVEVSLNAINDGKVDYCTVKVEALMTDAFLDDIDSRWRYLVLKDGVHYAYVAVKSDTISAEEASRLVNARVRVCGYISHLSVGQRSLLGSFVSVLTKSDIEVVKAAPEDVFDVPPLEPARTLDRRRLAEMDRRMVRGTVLAQANGGVLMLLRSSGEVVNVELRDVKAKFASGSEVEAVGFPETDLYRVIMAKADCRPVAGCGKAVQTDPEDISPGTLLTDDEGRPRYRMDYYGRCIRMVGVVRTMPGVGESFLNLECEGRLVGVDISALGRMPDGVQQGARVSATGICRLVTAMSRPSEPFPHVNGFTLVARTPEDLQVVSAAPWWTPLRLASVLGVLVLVLVASGVWILILRRLVERRGRELYRSQIAKVSADLRVDERTRLAVELHDSLAQNLTGVAMQIAAANVGGVSPAVYSERLSVAEHMLKSCRTELRRCLWDLRSEALEERDFAAAIRRTLAPVSGSAEVSVRFNVPRSRVSDQTAHAVLSIVRELVSNAVCHGEAKRVHVAGELVDGRLRFSVSDDGKGFDVAVVPGPDAGHFGLKGIRERVKRFGGTFEIGMGRGGGARAVVAFGAAGGEEA